MASRELFGGPEPGPAKVHLMSRLVTTQVRGKAIRCRDSGLAGRETFVGPECGPAIDPWHLNAPRIAYYRNKAVAGSPSLQSVQKLLDSLLLKIEATFDQLHGSIQGVVPSFAK